MNHGKINEPSPCRTRPQAKAGQFGCNEHSLSAQYGNDFVGRRTDLVATDDVAGEVADRPGDIDPARYLHRRRCPGACLGDVVAHRCLRIANVLLATR
jgi:hypothetical protein